MARIYIKRRYTIVALSLIITVAFLFLILEYKRLPSHKQHISSRVEDAFDSDMNALMEKDKMVVINETSDDIILDNDNIMQVSKQNKAITKAENIHAFYYAWYGDPLNDGKYYHWNHRFLPHWDTKTSKQYATNERHIPPNDIGANFYPMLGPYSSLDPKVVAEHMKYCNQAEIRVLSLSWYPPGLADDEGKPLEKFIPSFLNIAHKYGIKVCFHIEPYKGRTAATVAKDIEHLIKSYGSHPAFYTTNNPKRNSLKQLPLVYVYDSYLILPSHWWEFLGHTSGSQSIRGTPYDAVVIGLLVEQRHKEDITGAGFDGFYTYFASSGFSYGSNEKNWKSLSNFANSENLLFIPSVGPGYIDTNIRPWNGVNTRRRNNGGYYEDMWSNAVSASPDFVTITSFNEWHEGTQIEPAEPDKSVRVNHYLGLKRPGMFTYDSYGSNPSLYLDLTKKWIDVFLGNR